MTDTPTSTIGAPEHMGAMTPAQASERLETLTADKAWREKYLSGDGAARSEFEALTQAKAKADRIDAVLAGTLESPDFETTHDGEMPSRQLAQGVEDLRQTGVDEGVLRSFLQNEPIKPADRRYVENYKKQLLSNADFTKRYLAGDAGAVKEMTTVNMHLTREVAKEN